MVDNLPTLPLTIISGYLGAGKTTLVNHLLRNANGRRLMVLVNDFGELPIDADLIESEEGDTLNLSNGCACCSMGGDLFNALVDALDRTPRPDHLLIEASGVADPARIANIARAEPDLSLDAIISLADAETILHMINDKQVGETVHHQLVTSDLILLNKLDLVDESDRMKLVEQMEKIAPNAKIIETEFSQIPIDMAVGMDTPDKSRSEEQISTGSHHGPYVKWSKIFQNRLSKVSLEKAIDQLGNNILRLKGIVFFTDSDVPHIVQCVGSRCTITPIQQPDMSNEPHSRLVAIGLKDKLDVEMLDNIFELCHINK